MDNDTNTVYYLISFSAMEMGVASRKAYYFLYSFPKKKLETIFLFLEAKVIFDPWRFF